VFRAGAIGDIGREIEAIGLGRVAIVATPGRGDQIARLTASLGDRAVVVFARAALHVPARLVDDAVAEIARASPDGLLAIGGGSAIGLGKAIAVRTHLPLVAVPTTYSGSEMTAIWGITDDTGKRTARDLHAAPAVVIYDPELTLSLPVAASAASGINAVAHAVEALYAPNLDPLVALAAEGAIRTMAIALPAIVRSPSDLAARTAALRAAYLGGFALDNAVMGLHHKLAHVLGGTFGLPHAEAHAALLPHVVAFNEPAAPEAMRVIAAALGAATATEGIRALNASLGLRARIGDLGLGRGDIDRAAALSVQSAYPNPRPVTREDVRALLERAISH
jgi:maleylacetate reductase